MSYVNRLRMKIGEGGWVHCCAQNADTYHDRCIRLIHMPTEAIIEIEQQQAMKRMNLLFNDVQCSSWHREINLLILL